MAENQRHPSVMLCSAERVVRVTKTKMLRSAEKKTVMARRADALGPNEIARVPTPNSSY